MNVEPRPGSLTTVRSPYIARARSHVVIATETVREQHRLLAAAVDGHVVAAGDVSGHWSDPATDRSPRPIHALADAILAA